MLYLEKSCKQYNKYEERIIYPSGKIIAHDNRYIVKEVLMTPFKNYDVKVILDIPFC